MLTIVRETSIRRFIRNRKGKTCCTIFQTRINLFSLAFWIKISKWWVTPTPMQTEHLDLNCRQLDSFRWSIHNHYKYWTWEDFACIKQQTSWFLNFKASKPLEQQMVLNLSIRQKELCHTLRDGAFEPLAPPFISRDCKACLLYARPEITCDIDGRSCTTASIWFKWICKIKQDWLHRTSY